MHAASGDVSANVHTVEVRAAGSPEYKVGLVTAALQHFVEIVKTFAFFVICN
jgi:hypothetical protein